MDDISQNRLSMRDRKLSALFCYSSGAAFSFAAGTLLGVLLIHSYRWADGIRHASDDGRVEFLFANCGEIVFEFEQTSPPYQLPHWKMVREFASPRYDQNFGAWNSRWIPFKWGKRTYTWLVVDSFHDIFIPIWVPILACVCLSLLCFRRLFVRGRKRSSANNVTQA